MAATFLQEGNNVDDGENDDSPKNVIQRSPQTFF